MLKTLTAGGRRLTTPEAIAEARGLDDDEMRGFFHTLSTWGHLNTYDEKGQQVRGEGHYLDCDELDTFFSRGGGSNLDDDLAFEASQAVAP